MFCPQNPCRTEFPLHFPVAVSVLSPSPLSRLGFNHRRCTFCWNRPVDASSVFSHPSALTGSSSGPAVPVLLASANLLTLQDLS